MPKRVVPPFENENVILRPLEISDLPLTLRWRNQDEVRKWFVYSDVLSVETHYGWYENYKDLDDDFVFIILAKDLGNMPVGQISLYRIDWDLAVAEYGRVMIGEQPARGKGYASQATKLLLEHGFKSFQLKEITLEVRDDNKTAIALYKSRGFAEKARTDGFITMFVSSTQGNHGS
jgi:RimJ/RimL family protein N-acetyltransferase